MRLVPAGIGKALEAGEDENCTCGYEKIEASSFLRCIARVQEKKGIN